MKLSHLMRQNLNQIAEDGETALLYASQMEPLAKRGLVEWKMRAVQITVFKPVGRLTELGWRVKYQNTDE